MSARSRCGRPRAAAGVVAALLTLAVAACSHHDPGSRYGSVSPLPPHSASPTPTPTPTGTQGMSDQAQVKALYLDFMRHYPQAQMMSEAHRRTFLRQWLADPVLTRYLDSIQAQVGKHQRFEGMLRPRIIGAKVSGTAAVVDDCLDASHGYVRDVRTKRIIARNPKTRVWNVARLKKTSAGWRIYDTRPRSESCVRH